MLPMLISLQFQPTSYLPQSTTIPAKPIHPAPVLTAPSPSGSDAFWIIIAISVLVGVILGKPSKYKDS